MISKSVAKRLEFLLCSSLEAAGALSWSDGFLDKTLESLSPARDTADGC